MTTKDLQHKKIAILGGGLEGMALATFLKKHKAHITILNQKEEKELEKQEQEEINKLHIPVIFGKSAFANLSSYDIVFRSPGIKPNAPEIEEAKKNGVIITSQTQLFFDLCPCQIIGVTGTKGKGTTSSLIAEMLREQGFDTYLGGNIGVPPISFLDKLTAESKVVLELSSFQLQDLNSSPHVAVMLMTTSEHLDYHSDVYEYIDAKRNILRHQKDSDFAILNKDYPASNESDIETPGRVYRVSREQGVEEGCYVKDEIIYIKIGSVEEKVINIHEILLPGRHNIENVGAAILAGIVSGAKLKAIIHVLKTFKGLEHRLELVKTVRGVRYYDDSFSTTPETAIAAIEAFSDPEILILGGSSKNSDFTELGNVINDSKNIKAIIGIGEEWTKIKNHIKNEGIEIFENSKNMEDVVKKASEIATLGDVVLLSPACASFGMFRNYKERGNQFKEKVNSLTA